MSQFLRDDDNDDAKAIIAIPQVFSENSQAKNARVNSSFSISLLKSTCTIHGNNKPLFPPLTKQSEESLYNVGNIQ